MPKFFIVSILSLLAFIPSAAQKTEPAPQIPDSVFEADPYFLLMGEADAAIADKNWPEAAARLCDALAVKPDAPSNALLYNNLATVYTYLGNDSLALATFDKGLGIAPRMLTLIVGRGRTLLSMGKRRPALDDFSRAIAIDSLATSPRFYHGMISLYSGDATAAEDDFRVLARVAPQSIETATALATLYSLTGRERQAIPYLEKLIEVEPSAEYFASLAGCHLALGELTEASQAIGEGLKHYPDDPELYYYRAWLNRDRFRSDDAHADARRAITLGANPAKVNDLFNQLPR